ncbi:MAG: nicotinate-nucleotide adenylyltransferase [Candidatus Puniceispirillaceae bacterium]
MGKYGLPNRSYRHHLPRLFSYQNKRRIGLLGGSFNPAHDGHIAVSEKAQKAGNFDEIWWLVSPQNPLKSSQDMADFHNRLAFARQLAAQRPAIKVLALESQIGTCFTYDLLVALQKRAKKADFTWLMGSDNLVQFPRWYKAAYLAQMMPFMVMRRHGSFYQALASKGRRQIAKKGTITFIRDFEDQQSATALREAGKGL